MGGWEDWTMGGWGDWGDLFGQIGRGEDVSGTGRSGETQLNHG